MDEAGKRRRATVGWVVALDQTVLCVGCAPDPSAARRLAFDTDDETVRVSAVNRAYADAYQEVCERCGRML